MINTEQCKFLKSLREQPVKKNSIDEDFAESLLKGDYVQYIDDTIKPKEEGRWKGFELDLENAYLQITQTGISAVEEFERAVREEYAQNEAVKAANKANKKATVSNVIAFVSFLLALAAFIYDVVR